MSDHPPPPDPYGERQPPQPPPQANPYGAQPPAYGQGYGQGYGGYGTASQRDPDRRPGTVTAAGVVTIVFSALTALAFGAVVIAFQAARDDMVRALRDDSTFGDYDPGTVVDVGLVVGVVFVVWCLGAIVLAVLTMKRSRVARILLVVSAVASALISLVGILSVITVVTLAASISAIVLLFTGGANEWFAGRDGKPAPPPPPLATTAF